MKLPIDPMIAVAGALCFAVVVLMTAVASTIGAQWYVLGFAVLCVVAALAWLVVAVVKGR